MKKWAYYNDNDPFVCEWARNLVRAGLVPDGEVDCRSILEVESGDIIGFRQVHFFCGILGWPYALRLAGWGDAPVWTGSCPCQPLSSAGQRKGHADERHLWPAFHALIAECRPTTVFGEQVASRDGREWLAGVRADLEHLGYAVGAADLPAAGVGAPHIRARLFWVADHDERGREGDSQSYVRAATEASRRMDTDRNGAAGGLGDGADDGRGRRGQPQYTGQQSAQGLQPDRSGARGFWEGAVWLPCLDGKARRAQPEIFPLADGIPNRVGLLRGAGNAVVPQAAAEFVRAFMEST